MSEKKNIDRLFQEKFKDFEVTPDPANWEKIKNRKKDKKRILLLPLWYRVGGIAAAIAVLLTLGYNIFGVHTTEQQIVDTTEDLNTENTAPEQEIFDNNSAQQNAVVSSNPSENSNEKIQEKPESFEDKTNTYSRQNNNDSQFVLANTTPTKTDTGKIENIQNTTQINTSIAENQKPESISNQNNINATTINDTAVANTDVSSNTNPEEKNIINETELDTKKSIFDAIAEQELEEDPEQEKSSIKRWNITPNIAPVYYDAIGDGSSVQGEFADNSKSGEFNMSYGVQVAYAINKKLSVRSGVNKLDLSYNTEDIGFGVASVNNGFAARGGSDNNIQQIIVADLQDRSMSEEITSANINTGLNPGTLNHSLSYIEIPVEITYTLVDKKFGVAFIGGISTLILNKDELTVFAGGFKNSNIQREEFNANTTSFSGNLGLGFNYKLSEKFKMNLEPTLKYQMNGFTNSSEDFNPFYVGVYTGLTYSF